MDNLIPRRLTQPKTMLVLVIAIVVLGFISLSNSTKAAHTVGGAPAFKAAVPDQRRSPASPGSSKADEVPLATEDGNIDYCEILREPVLLNQRSHWDNFAQNSKGALNVPDRSEGDIGNWFGTLAYFSSIETDDLENPHRFFTSCELACAQNEECVSFLYERYMTEIDNHKYIDKHQDRCYLNKNFQYGTERLPKVDYDTKPGPGEVWNGRSWTAGWHRDRAEAWLINEKGCVRPMKKPSRREREALEAQEAERHAGENAAAEALQAAQAAAAAGTPSDELTPDQILAERVMEGQMVG